MDANVLKEVLNDSTGKEWSVSKDTVGLYRFSLSWYVVTVEARNPKEDNTWRLTIQNNETNESAAIGPVKEQSVDVELYSLVNDFFNNDV